MTMTAGRGSAGVRVPVHRSVPGRSLSGHARAAGSGGTASHLGARPALELHHVGGEVGGAAQQAAAHTVGVDRHAGRLEARDALRIEAPAHHDAHLLETLGVEGPAHLAHELRRDADGAEAAHGRPERAVDHGLRRVEAHAPEALAQGARARQAGADAVVVEVDERDDVDARVVDVGEAADGLHGVAAARGDEGVRHRPDALASPPRRLRVGAHTDRSADVRGVPVAGLHPSGRSGPGSTGSACRRRRPRRGARCC